jgi:hypothetical protein
MILPFVEDRRMYSDNNPIQKRYIDFNSPRDVIPTGGRFFFNWMLMQYSAHDRQNKKKHHHPGSASCV